MSKDDKRNTHLWLIQGTRILTHRVKRTYVEQLLGDAVCVVELERTCMILADGLTIVAEGVTKSNRTTDTKKHFSKK